MKNIEAWGAAIVAKKIFESEFDTNDFTSLFISQYPHMKGVELSVNIAEEREIFESTALEVIRSYGTGGLECVAEMLKSQEENAVVNVSIFDPIKVKPSIHRDYLESHHILDDTDAKTKPEHVYAMDVKCSVTYLATKEDDEYCDSLLAMDVVLSSKIDYLIGNIQRAIDLQSKVLNEDFDERSKPVSVAIRRGDKVLFEFPIQDLAPGNEPASKQPGILGIAEPVSLAPDLDRITVIDATLKDISNISSRLTDRQARRVRGQLLENELGM